MRYLVAARMLLGYLLERSNEIDLHFITNCSPPETIFNGLLDLHRET